MNIIEEALKYDEEGDIAKAVNAYEKGIEQNKGQLVHFFNLAVIYFMMMDFGFSTSKKIPEYLLKKAEERFDRVLTLAEKKFGKNSEIIFWRKYYEFIVVGEELSLTEVEKIAKSGNSLVPYIHLYSIDKKKEYRDKCSQLFEIMKNGRTERERYIKSILEVIL